MKQIFFILGPLYILGPWGLPSEKLNSIGLLTPSTKLQLQQSHFEWFLTIPLKLMVFHFYMFLEVFEGILKPKGP